MDRCPFILSPRQLSSTHCCQSSLILFCSTFAYSTGDLYQLTFQPFFGGKLEYQKEIQAVIEKTYKLHTNDTKSHDWIQIAGAVQQQV